MTLPNPQAYWRMASIGGGQVTDETGNGNHLTVTGCTLIAAGGVAGRPAVRALVATGGAAVSASGVSLCSGAAYSVSMWLRRIAPFDDGRTFIGSRDGGGNESARGPNTTSGPTVYSFIGEAVTHTAADIIHIVLTGTASGTDYHINGGPSISAAGSLQPRNTAFPLRFMQNAFGIPIDGELSEVAVYGEILSADEITEIYNRGLAGASLMGTVPEGVAEAPAVNAGFDDLADRVNSQTLNPGKVWSHVLDVRDLVAATNVGLRTLDFVVPDDAELFGLETNFWNPAAVSVTVTTTLTSVGVTDTGTEVETPVYLLNETVSDAATGATAVEFATRTRFDRTTDTKIYLVRGVTYRLRMASSGTTDRATATLILNARRRVG